MGWGRTGKGDHENQKKRRTVQQKTRGTIKTHSNADWDRANRKKAKHMFSRLNPQPNTT